MLEIVKISDQDTARFLFSGDLSVAIATELQQQLLKVNLDVSRLEIMVQNVENIDLSFLQLLFSWAQSMSQSGKKLIFDFRLGEEFDRIFDESGFKEVFDQL